MNKKLKKPPLVEAVFELRLQPGGDYGLLLARLNEKLKNKYPKGEATTPQLPIGLASNIYRHRFYSVSKKELYQVGENILSINSLKYISFNNFLADIKKVIKVYREVSKISKIQRMGLRYVNKIEEKDVDRVLSSQLIIAKDVKYKKKGILNRILFYVPNIGEMGVIIEQNHEGNTILLDLDCYKSDETPFTLEKVTKWIEDAHSEIYKTFESFISKEYFRKLQ
jgi:uncharacterized protein (TIGR04255 family)